MFAAVRMLGGTVPEAYAAVWVALIARLVAKLSYIPLGPIVMLTLFALIIGRAMQARSDIRVASTSLAAIRSN
jgi:hypothetical protein